MPLHALFIGINQYEADRDIPQLRYAHKDARLLYALFSEALGHDAANIHLLDVPNSVDAFKQLKAIGKRVRSGDSFLFFFSGHGHQFGNDQLLLLPQADLKDILAGRRTGVDVLSLRDMVDETNTWPNVQSMFLLDACRTDLGKLNPAGSKSSANASAPPDYSPRTLAELMGVGSRSPLGGYSNIDSYGSQASDSRTALRSPPAILGYGCNAGQMCFELERAGNGSTTHTVASWLRDGIKNNQPRVFGKQTEQELNHRMQRHAQEHAPDIAQARAQQIWITATTEVVLYKPTRSDAPIAAAPPPTAAPVGPTGPSAQALDDRRWHRACLENTKDAYDCYLDNAPDDAKHIDEAMAAIEQLINGPARAVAALAKTEFVRPGRVFRDAPWAPEMVIIPAGSFLMGSPESERMPMLKTDSTYDEIFNCGLPRHSITIAKPFALGKYAVTFDDYDRYAQAAGVEKPRDQGWGRGNRPVINVSWNDAQAYIKWLNEQPEIRQSLQGQQYRLPSEVEWEYAARAGTTTRFSTGDQITTEQGNFNGNYKGAAKSGKYLQKTTPVGSYPSNPWGLSDMHGNVWETVQDCWNNSYQGAPSNEKAWETGDCSRRVIRGGSWNSDSELSRSAFRMWEIATNRGNFVGLRLARTTS